MAPTDVLTPEAADATGAPVTEADGAPAAAVAPDPEPTHDATAVYRPAEGTELQGEYQGSAFEQPKFLVTRGDGQVMQLPLLLYRVLGSLDGRTAEAIAEALTAELGQPLTGEQIAFLVEERLRPVGVIAAETDSVEDAPAPVKSDPLLGLRYRAGVIPARTAWHIAGVFRFLFARPAWMILVAGFLAVQVAVLLRGDVVGQVLAAITQVIHQPTLLLLTFVIGMVFGAFHECGHITACRYGGARPGDVGVGIYIVWPALYSTVTDSYRLSRVGRLRTDLGGIYFNTIFLTGLGLVYLQTGQPWLLLAILTLLGETAWQFLPSVRLDGYYILADLVGVPDLFGYVRPALQSLLPGRPTHPKVRELKPRSRRLVVLWVALVVPTIAISVVVFLLALPLVLPVVWRSTLDYLHTLDAAARSGDLVATTLGVSQLVFLLLPWLGTVLITWSLVQLLSRRTAARRGPARLGAHTRTVLRRVVVGAWLAALGTALVVRVAAVAGTHPATAAETRLAGSALAGVEHLGSGPSVGPLEALTRAQLVWYARLTGAFDRHASVVVAGRELAVVATAVVVAALLALVAARRVRPLAVALPLLAAVAMGPVVTTLATVGPGVVALAWAAVGAALIACAPGRTAVVLGAAAVAMGVATEPLLAAPLAAGIGVAILGGRARRDAAGPRHARPGPPAGEARRWLAVLLVLPIGGAAAVLATGAAPSPLDGSEQAVVLLLGCLVTGVGLLVRRLRPVAAVAATALVLTVIPGAATSVVLPTVVTAVVLLAALLLDAVSDTPRAERPHPLLRAAVVLPAVVLALVGSLFLPVAASPVPDAQLAGWITGPASAGGTVAVPAGMWADLVHDGVPADRLVPVGSAAVDEADWVVDRGPAAGTVTFGGGSAALTVRPSASAEAARQARTDAEQRDLDLRRRDDEAQLATRQAFGAVLARSPRITGPAEGLGPLGDGAVDPRVMTALGLLTQRHGVSVAGFPAAGPGPDGGLRRTVVIGALDGRSATRPGAVAVVTEELRGLPADQAPAAVQRGPGGLTVTWS